MITYAYDYHMVGRERGYPLARPDHSYHRLPRRTSRTTVGADVPLFATAVV